jgi:hypothetical protein
MRFAQAFAGAAFEIPARKLGTARNGQSFGKYGHTAITEE